MTGASPGNNALKVALHRIHEQAGGAIALEVVRLVDVPELIGHALAGDPDAYRILQITNNALRGIQNAPARKPMLCGSCPRPLRAGRYAIVATFPLRADAADGMGLAICTHCATTIPEIKARAVQALQRFWPDGRLVDAPIHNGGRA